jgi:CHAD domain-containing protein
MPFRLTTEETVEKGIRRILSEELEYAICNLRKEDESLGGEGIHEARKSIKKLRAITRLLMPGLGAAGVRDNRALRDTGRSLSGLRDAAALIETVEGLSEQYFSDPAIEQLAVVRSALRRRLEDTVRSEDCRTVVGGAVASLKALKKRMGKWQIAGGSFAAIAPGLENTYRRGRKSFRRAKENPVPENLHALRKRVKEHWYHVRLLEGAFSKISLAPSREKELGRIQEWLGDDHNLNVLSDALKSEPAAFGGKKIVPAVLGLIGRAQKVLQEQSLAAAVQIYEAKPGKHVLDASEAWEAWQTGTAISKPVVAETPVTPARRRGSAA